MQKTHWKDIVEVVGIAAIVASLIFVGLEMRQTRAIALAATYQTQADSEMFVVSFMQQPHILPVFIKLETDEALTQYEQWLLVGSLNVWFTYLENIHFQIENGMLSREILDGHLLGIKSLLAHPKFIEYWELTRNNWRPSFSRDIDEFLDGIDRNTGSSE